MKRDDLIKFAEALGWMRCERNGVEVWYDPEGGHVSWAELPQWLERSLDRLIAGSSDKTLLLEDRIALAKLGNPFVDPSRS